MIAVGSRHLPLFLVFLLLSLAIGVTAIVFTNPALLVLSHVALIAIFVSSSVFAKRSRRYSMASDLLLAFGIFTTAALVREICLAVVGIYLPGNQTVVPFVDTASILIVVLILSKVSGSSMGSIYLKKGNLRLGLSAGLIGFFALFTGILIGFQLFYGEFHGISFGAIGSLAPVVLVLAFLNAPKEEIWFRGLFLRKSEKLFGRNGANVLQAPLFTLAHLNAQYSQFGILFQLGFLVLVLGLGLFWGYFTQRTDSIIGSSLIHAGADVAIFLPILL